MNFLDRIKGKFITFEGIEGAGKSTQSKLLVEYLNNHGVEAIYTREPGGCPEAEEIRNLLINGSVDKWDATTELLLMYSSRKIHTEKKIKPLLEKGVVVVSDRYFDSTTAYQGYGYNFDLEKIEKVKKIVLDDFKPDTTIILDLNVLKGLERANKRGDANRFESMKIEFHMRVRNGFKKIAEAEPERCTLINVENYSINELHMEIIRILDESIK